MYREVGTYHRVYFNPQHVGWNLSTYNIWKYCHPVHHQKAGHGLGTSTRKCMLQNQLSLSFTFEKVRPQHPRQRWSTHNNLQKQQFYFYSVCLFEIIASENEFYLPYKTCTLCFRILLYKFTSGVFAEVYSSISSQYIFQHCIHEICIVKVVTQQVLS